MPLTVGSTENGLVILDFTACEPPGPFLTLTQTQWHELVKAAKAQR
jgi:hypothetical protein